jgi:hypothetical protein
MRFQPGPPLVKLPNYSRTALKIPDIPHLPVLFKILDCRVKSFRQEIQRWDQNLKSRLNDPSGIVTAAIQKERIDRG